MGSNGTGQAARDRVVLAFTLVGIALGVAVFIQWTVNTSIQDNRSHLSVDQPQHIEVTDVIKALVVYIQVGSSNRVACC